MIRVAGIADSPKLQTGFGNVARELFKGFNEEFDFSAFGILDWQPDFQKQLPYAFYPADQFSLMGFGASSTDFIKQLEPDIVWIMIDPGNLTKWVVELGKLNVEMSEYGKGFKVIAYPPIEGEPVSKMQMLGIKTILKHGGDVVLWCKAAQEAVARASDLNLDFIYFGNDHADFKPQDTTELRKKLGLHDTFLVGSVGVNKRTKGFPTLIYAAQELKNRGVNDVTFYCHTNAHHPTMQGYRLLEMAETYGVEDMFVWKDDIRNNMYQGVAYSNDTFDHLDDIEINTPEKWTSLWNSLDYITRVNCLDLYVDVSQVEGWGLPVAEAMACGIPVVTPIDHGVRSEVFAEGVYSYPPTPRRTWDTWHTGVRLVGVDSDVVADVIIEMKDNPELRSLYSKKGMEHMKQFTWNKARKAMNQRVRNLYDS